MFVSDSHPDAHLWKRTMFNTKPRPTAPGRATAAETDARIEQAADLLADGMEATDAVACISEMHGLSTRQAQRIVRRGRARLLIEEAPTMTAAISHGLVDQMVADVGDAIREAMAEGDRRGAAALLHRWSDLVAKTAPTLAPADAWDRSLATATRETIPF